MNRILIDVDNLSQVLKYYNVIKVYRAIGEEGSYDEITDINTQIELIPEKEQYYYSDDSGDNTHWYKTSYYNTATTDESELSVTIQGGSEVKKVGYTFKNYTPPVEEWGQVLTADDIRFQFMWGIDLVANNDEKVEVQDSQLEFAVESAMAEFEHYFNIDIRKRIYKSKPVGLTRAVIWREGVDYTDEDEPYDFDPAMWKNFGFLRLRHRPIISVESAILQSPYQTDVIDLTEWVSIRKKPGQLTFYPKGSTVYGTGYMGSGILAAWPGMVSRRYPQGYKIDYTTGFESSDFIPNDLRNAIGMLATVNILGWVSEGLLSGFSSSSVSLDGLSESFSSTQSATSISGSSKIKGFGSIRKMYKKRKKLIGKKIISVNKKTGKHEFKDLLDVLKHDVSNKKCFKIKTYNGKKIIITEDHSLFGLSIEKLRGSEIKTDTILKTFEDTTSVKSIKEVKRKWMYDLCVKDNENFIANDFVCCNSSYFGARIKALTDELKKYINDNKLKYGNIPMGFI